MDLGQDRRQPTDATVGACTMAAALRACERALLKDAGENLDGLPEPLRLLSRCAHRAHVPPGGMVIHLKHALDASARALRLPPRRADEVRIRVVALAISEYIAAGEER